MKTTRPIPEAQPVIDPPYDFIQVAADIVVRLQGTPATPSIPQDKAA